MKDKVATVFVKRSRKHHLSMTQEIDHKSVEIRITLPLFIFLPLVN